tara:strand:+ start:196 stop:1137 length:942 start_codon:yes stop_codon:yes gene_type:complete
MKLPSETISGAFELYQTTPEFQKKITSQKTRQQYAYQQNRVCELKIDDGYVGDVPLAKLTVAKCQEIYWKILESVQSGDGIRFANYTLQIIVRAWNVLLKYDMLEGRNPWQFVERAKDAPRNKVWTLEQFGEFLTTAFSVPKWRNIGLLVRINVELGQRVEDIRLSTWINYDLKEKLYTREVIQKTKERIAGIPISDDLVQMLEDQKQDYAFQDWVVPHPIRLKPYSENNIARVFRQIMNATNLPRELQLRDIRRTVLSDLADRGCTETEIMSYSGHKNRESLAPYILINTNQARNAAAKRNFDPISLVKESK